ncbi:facilitated trehalose transporter Tret1-like [Euwallacea similis]|uniref:facilitated trehalose transporter Tret1-like n=1 Tax=Euwallacea similis TaxID=1736056 RepID=UPI00344CA18F
MGILNEAWLQVVATAVGTLMAVSNGMSYGWTSPMVPYFTGNTTHILITHHQGELLETMYLYGAAVGLPSSILVVNRYGRKSSMILSSLVGCICWIMILCTYNLYVVYVARFMAGVAGNMVFIGAPMYIAEIAEPQIRGFLSASIYTMQLLGFVLVYSAGTILPFYVVPTIGIILTTTEVVFFPFMPESPYFYVYTNKFNEAARALTRLRSKRSNIDKEIDEIKLAIERQKREKGRLQDMILIRSNRYALMVMLLLNTSEHCVGISVILMNLHLILKEADSAYMSSSMAGILFSVIMLLSATTASFFMDRFGRKSLLITSGLLTGIALTIMTVYFQLKFLGYDVTSISWIPIVCVMSYAAAFKLGLGIVPIVVTAEIFSAKVKALGMTIADLFYVFPAIASISIYTTFVDNYGIHVPFYVFSVSSFVAVGLIYWLVPETKGKTLEEIQLMLKGHHKIEVDEQQGQNALKNLIVT